MNTTGYKVIGFTVWHGAKWYVRRRVRERVPSRRVAVAGLVLGAAAVVLIAESKRDVRGGS